MERAIPAGPCSFYITGLNFTHTCPCKRFWEKRKPKSKAGREGGADHDDEEDDDGDVVCQCSHHAIYHDLHERIEEGTRGTIWSNESSLPSSLIERDPPPSVAPSSVFEASGHALVATRSPLPRTLPSIAHSEADRDSQRAPARSRSAWSTERDAASTKSSKSSQSQIALKPAFAPARDTAASDRTLINRPLEINSGSDAVLMNFCDKLLALKNSRASPESSHDSRLALNSSDLVEFHDWCRESLGWLDDRYESQARHHANTETLVMRFDEMEEKYAEFDARQDLMEENTKTEVHEALASQDRHLEEMLAPLYPLAQYMEDKKRKRHHLSQEEQEHREKEDAARKRARTQEPEEAEEDILRNRQTLETTPSFASGFTSFESTSTSPGRHRLERIMQAVEELQDENEAMQTKVAELEECLPPAPGRPLAWEVIVIPPCPLRGVWLDPTAKLPSSQREESQFTSCGSSMFPDSTPSTRDGTPAAESSELNNIPMPRPFSAASMTYKRLRSRGFIHTLEFTGDSARHVASMIDQKFRPILDWCKACEIVPISVRPTSGGSFDTAMANMRNNDKTELPQMLRDIGWKPLKKVYRKTQLKSLTPEDAIPIMWNIEFLKSTCLMRGRERKVLYITPTMGEANITWQDIKSMKRHYGPEDVKEKPGAGQGEDYWFFDEALDGPLASEPLESFHEMLHGLDADSTENEENEKQEATPPDSSSQTLIRVPSSVNLLSKKTQRLKKTNRPFSTDDTVVEIHRGTKRFPFFSGQSEPPSPAVALPASPPQTLTQSVHERNRAASSPPPRQREREERSPTVEDPPYSGSMPVTAQEFASSQLQESATMRPDESERFATASESAHDNAAPTPEASGSSMPDKSEDGSIEEHEPWSGIRDDDDEHVEESQHPDASYLPSGLSSKEEGSDNKQEDETGNYGSLFSTQPHPMQHVPDSLRDSGFRDENSSASHG